jgi:hypothetical protein
MARRSLALAASLAVGLAGCSTVQIATEYKQGVDHKKYKTFAWNPVEPGPEQATDARDPAVRRVVFKAIESELARIGIKKAAPDATPDFFIAVHGWSRDKIDVKQYGYVYGYTGYGMYATGGPAVEVRNYKEGTIVIDFIDPTAKEMFWRGTASDTFIPGTGEGAVKEAIAKLLKAYPPPQQ